MSLSTLCTLGLFSTTFPFKHALWKKWIWLDSHQLPLLTQLHSVHVKLSPFSLTCHLFLLIIYLWVALPRLQLCCFCCRFTLGCHPLTLRSILFCFLFFRCVSPSVCVCSESLVSPSSHPGRARAPPGGPNRGRPAGPGPAQTLRERCGSASQRVGCPWLFAVRQETRKEATGATAAGAAAVSLMERPELKGSTCWQVALQPPLPVFFFNCPQGQICFL